MEEETRHRKRRGGSGESGGREAATEKVGGVPKQGKMIRRVPISRAWQWKTQT